MDEGLEDFQFSSGAALQALASADGSRDMSPRRVITLAARHNR